MGSIGLPDIYIHQDRWEDEDWAHNIRPFSTTGPYFGPKNGQNQHFSTIFLTTSPRTFKMGSIGISDIDIHQDSWDDDDWAHNIRPFLTMGPYVGPKNGQNQHFSTIFSTTSPSTFKMGSVGISDIDIHQDRWEDDDWAQNIRPFPTTGPYFGPKWPFLRPK